VVFIHQPGDVPPEAPVGLPAHWGLGVAISKSRKSGKNARNKKRSAAGGSAGRSGNPAIRAEAIRQEAALAEQRPGPSAELFGGLGGFSERRRRLDAQHERLAGQDAVLAITELLGLARPLDEFEDELCRRMGALLSAQDPEPGVRQSQDFDPFKAYGPDQLLKALAAELLARAGAAAEAEAVLPGSPTDGERTPDPEHLWRLSVALTRISPHPVSRKLVLAVDRLGSRLGHGSAAVACAPLGPALWCRDAYGSRFAVTAPFPAGGDGADRWYLWDIDVCATDAFTVAAGYHPNSEAALAAWRDSAGREATQDAVLTPVDDPCFAARLLPALPDFLHPGGESESQYAEFHRCRRLAQELADSSALDGRGADAPEHRTERITKQRWIAEFRAWRAEHRPGESAVPPDYAPVEGEEPPTEQDLLEELADSWFMSDFPELSYACSPHRISRVTEQVLDFYLESFGSVLVGLLPDLAAWLTERTGLSAALAERSRACAADAAAQRKRADDRPGDEDAGPLTRVLE
jgi:hypothetical protein